MNDVIQPEWLKSYVPLPKGNPGWTRGGPSPNPEGRPKGIIDSRQRLQNAFANDAVDIAKVVIAKALEGDMQAANIALARIAPPLRPQAERVQFELSEDAPLSVQARQILQAISKGLLDADTARMLIDCMQSVAKIRATEELADRLAILEARVVSE